MDLFSDAEEQSLPFSIPENIECSCRWDHKIGVFVLKIPNGELLYSEHFFNKKISDRSVEYFQENDAFDWKNINFSEVSDEDFNKIEFLNIKWKHDKINMYGKQLPLPRLTSWYGDEGKSYTYSGITSHPNIWNKGLLYIKNEIEKVSSVKFNSVLLNWYRSGEDHQGWHSDDEKSLGNNPTIASVSFGETRDFIMRRKDDPTQKIVIPLKHGTLLIMKGELQHFWQHSVPKRKKVKNSRFNLTFRRILS